MNFKEQIAADAAIFFNQNEFAEPATYNGKAIFVIPEIGEGQNRGEPDQRRDMAYFEILKTDISYPKQGDVLVHDGIEWEFAEIAAIDPMSYTVKFYANESATWLR